MLKFPDINYGKKKGERFLVPGSQTKSEKKWKYNPEGHVSRKTGVNVLFCLSEDLSIKLIFKPKCVWFRIQSKKPLWNKSSHLSHFTCLTPEDLRLWSNQQSLLEPKQTPNPEVHWWRNLGPIFTYFQTEDRPDWRVAFGTGVERMFLLFSQAPAFPRRHINKKKMGSWTFWSGKPQNQMCSENVRPWNRELFLINHK